jgi:hypothetical protein
MSAALLVGHLVGDFLLQNDWMAQNKKTRTVPCLVHVGFYTFAVCYCAGWLAYPAAWLLVGVPHFLIDRTQFVRWYMQKCGQDAFAQPPMAPWSIIAVDNAMHALCLLWAAWVMAGGMR